MSTQCSTTRKPNAVIQGMARHPNIFAFLFAVIVSIIANYGDSVSLLSIASFNTKPVEAPPKQPTFWFPPHLSIVVDSPRGSLFPVVNILKQNEVVFVMFYASWCARSLEAKVEFEKAAEILKGKVTFAAVNCWWPDGGCSKQYKFLMYPAFFAYHTNLEGIKFVGVARADYMVNFVEKVLYPVSLVTSISQIQKLIAVHDSVVFGFFNLVSDVPIGSYRQFYYASMRILEKDPFQPVHFAIICNVSIAHQVHLVEHGDIIMAGITKNSAKFPHRNNITSSNIISWVLHHKGMPVVKRLSPLGVKSMQVFSEVKKGPALIMFHKENILFGAESGLRVVKDVAFHYKSCHLRPEYKSLHLIWKRIVEDDIRFYEKVSKMCSSIRKSQLLLKNSPCCMSAVINEKIKKNSLVCDICKTSNYQPCSISPAYMSSILSQTYPVEDCRCIVPSLLNVADLSICCRNSSQYELDVTEWVRYHQDSPSKMRFPEKKGDSQPSEQRRLTDRFYTEHLENLPRRLCSRLAIQKPDYYEPERDLNASDVEHFRELSCGFNRTLNFYSVDSKNNWMISERLGLMPENSSPGVVIFDMNNEEHYIMKENLTVSNTMSFILNFQLGNLQRHMNADSFEVSNCVQDDGSICVKEIGSNNFMEVVKDENKDVVVLIYAHWCGYCQTLSHTFLAVARYFSSSKYISFVRINGATNDLPWEYTVDAFPAILIFPAQREPFALSVGNNRRKADSVMFPPWKDKSLTNLIHFILHHTTFDTRLLLAADVCSKSCIHKNLNDSLSLVRELRNRHKRSHVKLEEISNLLTGVPKGDAYFRYLYEFLNKHLIKLTARIENVSKLIEYLRKNRDGVIDRKELMDLFIA